jgi:RimJ/RimL family protein N-acetyltransferase
VTATAHLAGVPVLCTERLVLRAPTLGDLPAWTAFAGSDRARFVGGPIDAGKAWRAFAHVAGMWALLGLGTFVFAPREAPGTPLGMAGPWRPVDWPEPEIGWTLWSEAAEGRGLAAEAAAAARAYAFRDLGWSTGVSYIHPDNARSIRLAERLGARLDRDALHPSDDPCLVYRHPGPAASA